MPSYLIVHAQSTVDQTETWCGEKLTALRMPHDRWTVDQHVNNFTCGACYQARRDYERAQEVIKHVKPSPISGLSSALAQAFAPSLVKVFPSTDGD